MKLPSESFSTTPVTWIGPTTDGSNLPPSRIVIAAPSPAAMPACTAFGRSEEHTSELQSLMRISYAVFCLKKQKTLSHHSTPPHNIDDPYKQHNLSPHTL